MSKCPQATSCSLPVSLSPRNTIPDRSLTSHRSGKADSAVVVVLALGLVQDQRFHPSHDFPFDHFLLVDASRSHIEFKLWRIRPFVQGRGFRVLVSSVLGGWVSQGKQDTFETRGLRTEMIRPFRQYTASSLN